MIGRIGIVAAMLAAAPVLANASVCDRLADFARKLPATSWAVGDEALAPALVFDHARPTSHKPSQVTPLEAALAGRKDIRDALSADDYEVFVDHPMGTDLYALSTVQGTLDCQTTVLVRATASPSAKIIDAPGSGDSEICWRTSESLGRAFGQPVHAVHDMVAPTAQTATLSLTPWTGASWGKTCTLELTFSAAYELTERRCGDETVCKPTEAIAQDLAVAYNRYREGGGDGEKFTFGPTASPAAEARVKAYLAARDPSDQLTPDFPAFAGKTLEDRPISYSGFALFPVALDGRDYVVGVGHEGVGWREGENTLVAFYSLKDRVLIPQAGFVLQRSLAALTKAEAH